MGAIDAPFIPLVPRRIVTSADQPDTALPLPPADAADDLDALHPSSTDDVTPTAGKSSPSPPREDLVSNTSGSAETAETARAPVDAGARLEDEAVRIAGLACARALGRALDIDAEIVRIFVRDAI
ncbi:MAG: hypothetical protein GIW99_06150, partial [Candidatus Eremiobacteraeota bacterium]|nr:hypothetical protein [Candidatus Eremiobacteraeota bacterium]